MAHRNIPTEIKPIYRVSSLFNGIWSVISKLLKLFLLTASLLSWQEISLQIVSSNRGERNKLKFESYLEELWSKISVVSLSVETQYLCTDCLRMLSSVRSSSSLLYSHILSGSPFPLTLRHYIAWLSLTTTNPTIDPPVLSPALPWQSLSRKLLQSTLGNTLLPSLPNPSSYCPTNQDGVTVPENQWWHLSTSASENGQGMCPCNWMYLIPRWHGRYKLFLCLPFTALS